MFKSVKTLQLLKNILQDVCQKLKNDGISCGSSFKAIVCGFGRQMLQKLRKALPYLHKYLAESL